MMKASMKYIAAMLLAVAFAACNSTVLTEPTTNGRGTVSFLVDGQVWRPSAFITFGYPPLIVQYGNEVLSVESARAGDDRKGAFSFACSGLQDSVAILSVDFSNARGHFRYRAPGPQEIIITRLDTVQKIISGRFTFTLATDKTDTNVAHITDGRFDFHYPEP